MTASNTNISITEAKEAIRKSGSKVAVDIMNRLDAEYERDTEGISVLSGFVGNPERQMRKLNERYSSVLTHLGVIAKDYAELKLATKDSAKLKALKTKVHEIMRGYVRFFWEGSGKPWNNAFGIDCLSELTESERNAWNSHLKESLTALVK